MSTVLGHIRKFSALFFSGIAIAFSLLCYSPLSSGLHIDTSNPYYFQADSEAPVLFHQSSGSPAPLLTYSPLPVFLGSFFRFVIDVPLLQVAGGFHLKISPYLRHIFYIVPTIHAP